MSIVARCLRGALALLLASSAPAPSGWADDLDLAVGVRQVDEGDFEGAIETLEPAALRLLPSRGPEAARAYLYLGIAHLALDHRETARRHFRQALDLDPELELSPGRFSPKVRGALDEARRERKEAAPVAKAPPAGAKKGVSGRAALLTAVGVSAGVGIAVAASGGSSSDASGEVRFGGARFAPPAIECPNGVVGRPIAVGLELEATNPGGPAMLTAVSSTLIIVSSPAVPDEVGFASSAPTTASPSVVPGGTTTLRLQTTLQCSNGTGDEPRFNEWSGRVTLATGAGAVNLETVDRLRVNIP